MPGGWKNAFAEPYRFQLLPSPDGWRGHGRCSWCRWIPHPTARLLQQPIHISDSSLEFSGMCPPLISVNWFTFLFLDYTWRKKVNFNNQQLVILFPGFSKAIIPDKKFFPRKTFASIPCIKHLEIFLLCETYFLHPLKMDENIPMYHDNTAFSFPEYYQQQFHCGLHQ